MTVPATVPTTGPALAQPLPPPSFAPAPEQAREQRPRRREPVLGGPLSTVVVAIGIVLVLAVVGILAGQVLGR